MTKNNSSRRHSSHCRVVLPQHVKTDDKPFIGLGSKLFLNGQEIDGVVSVNLPELSMEAVAKITVELNVGPFVVEYSGDENIHAQ